MKRDGKLLDRRLLTNLHRVNPRLRIADLQAIPQRLDDCRNGQSVAGVPRVRGHGQIGFLLALDR